MKLPRIQTDQEGYTLLEVDNGVRWLSELGLETDLPANRQLVVTILRQLVAAGQGTLSGVVVDPDFGPALLSVKSATAGVIWQLEQPMVSTDPLSLPKLASDWNVEHIRNNLGLAKLELYYHPAEKDALLKKQFVAEIFDFCRYQQIDLLLKLSIYSPNGQSLSTADFQQAQLTAIQELRTSTDLFALQSPKESLAAATVTAELDIPWILHSQDGQPYDVYKEQLRQALEAGAKGFLIDETLWQEAYKLRRKDQGVDEVAITNFMQTTVRDRMLELARIVGENLAV